MKSEKKSGDLASLVSNVQSTPNQPDEETSAHIQALRIEEIKQYKHKNEKQSLEIKKLEEEIEQLKSDRIARKRYGRVIFAFVIGYLIFAAILVYHQNTWKINDSVTIAFLGTTVVNTVGLLMGVVRYLFK